jgi:hypothetical protein
VAGVAARKGAGLNYAFEQNAAFSKNPSFQPPLGYILAIHTTKPANIPAILREGIVPGRKSKNSSWGNVHDDKNVWFWRDVENDPRFANWNSKTEAVVIFAVPSNVWKDSEGSHASIYGGSVPPEWIYGTIRHK